VDRARIVAGVLLGPPRLWGWLTREWIPLPSALAWLLWRAIGKVQWSASVEWREQFLAFEKPNRVLSRDMVEDFLGEIASPKNLMGLLEALKQEKMLIRHDAHRLEEGVPAVLEQKTTIL
jgi:hypothetical protein